MKKFKLLTVLFSLVAIISASTSCKKETPSVVPTIDLQVSGTTENSISVSISAQNATSVKYIYIIGNELTTEAADIMANGTSFDFGSEQTLTISELESNTTYTIAAAAENDGTLSQVAKVQATTSEQIPEPTISISDVQTTHNTITFTVTSANGDSAKWLTVKKGSREVSIEDIFNHGQEFETNTTVTITAQELDSETEYQVYAGIKNEKYEEFTVVEATTLRETLTYVVNPDEASGSKMSFSDSQNYFVTFTDSEKGYTLKLDFYDDVESKYLSSGTFELGSSTAGYLGSSFTSFQRPDDENPLRFSEGEVTIIATPNEETREVHYQMTGTFTIAELGDIVTLEYNGLIPGIQLPEDQPDQDYYEFIPDPSTSQPRRITANGEVPGQYYIKFNDTNWNELTLDIYIDPTICNNGNDGLPAGTYTVEDGHINTQHSKVDIYSYPYFYGNFTECTLEVSVNGDEYTFDLIGTAVDGSNGTLNIKMTYIGEIKDMKRQ